MATRIPDNEASFSLQEIATACAGQLLHASGTERVTGVVTDSRRVRVGSLYVALRGEHHDGHGFLAASQSAGAAAVLVDDLSKVPTGLAAIGVSDVQYALGELARFHRERWSGRVIAVTGSAGKTTTKELIARLLGALGAHVCRTEGNLNNLIGVPMTLFTLDADVSMAVVEVGTSATGEIARLAEIARPDVGVVTTVATAHTRGLGSLADVAREKTALLRALSARGTAIYGVDSAALCAAAAEDVVARVLTFGRAEAATLRLLDLRHGADGRSRCRFATPVGEIEADFGLLGEGPALDAAAALCVVWAEQGTDALVPAARALAGIAPVAGRLAPRPGPAGCLILDDTYNANPASVRASLLAVADLARVRGGRAVAVLGDMGDLGVEAVAAHRAVGSLVLELGLAQLVACGPQMAEAARTVLDADTASIRVDQVADALQARGVLQPLRAQDVLLVKGSRFMAMERLVQALAGEPAQ